LFVLSLLACVAVTRPAHAQNYSFDARNIALGGVGSGNGNIGASMVDEQKPYKSIVIPLGLFQVLRDLDIYDPDSDEFDPVLAAEYAISPIHWIVGRDGEGTGNDFVTDILNGELSRNLNSYQGFVPAAEITAEGLANPVWGHTFKFAQRGSSFHGIYAGAGPYLSMQTHNLTDETLRMILGSDTPVLVPNASFGIANTLDSQLALSVTGGYRARLPIAGWTGDLDGLYLGANYNFLKGFIYEAFDTTLRLDTNDAGLLVVNPQLPAPLRVARDSSKDGIGFAIDVGAGFVLDRWRFGFATNGIANRIDWTDVERTLYTMESFFTGDGEFDDTPLPVIEPEVRVELPVDYRAYLAYETSLWGWTVEWSNGYQGTTLRGGLEKKWNSIEVRGGARYVSERWEPSGGVGFNLSPGFGIDVAGFGTSANLERDRNVGIAISLRLRRGNVP
jgi:hypothetical protein